MAQPTSNVGVCGALGLLGFAVLLIGPDSPGPWANFGLGVALLAPGAAAWRR